MNQLIVHLADGFEEVEAVTIIDVLRRAGLNVITVSVSKNRMVKGAHNIEVKADFLFEEVDYEKGSMIILPGGMPGAKNLNDHEGLQSELIKYRKSGKHIAAICAAPMVLGNLGILKGINAVCYPGFEQYLVGADIKNVPFIVDDKIITGRGVGAALGFALEIVKIVKSNDSSLQLRKAMLVEN